MTSDQTIPRTCDIIARALDIRESAVRMHDDSTVRQIDRVITKLPGARLCWQLGTLIIKSPSGSTYRVSRAGCDCLNAQRCGKRQCWHVATFELLLDIQDTQVEDNDQVADIGALFAERLEVTARIVTEMRRSQMGYRYDEAAYWAEYRHERM